MTHYSLPVKLRVLRAERGLTLREVEELSGVAKETISDIERGTRHPLDATLAKLARAYHVPLEELLEERDAEGKAEAGQESRHEGSTAPVDQERQALDQERQALMDRVADLEAENARMREAEREGNIDFFYRILQEERDHWRNRAVDLEEENAGLRQENERLTALVEDLRAAIHVALVRGEDR
jgi:transcriptional regulator with XRE-family HTH domain